MPEPLANARLKIERAKEHIEQFKSMLKAWNNSRPYVIGTKIDTQAGQHVYYIEKAESLSPGFSAVAGDVIHNLRSALDHIAYEMCTGSGQTPPKPWEIEFPIADDAAKFPSLRDRKVKGARPDAIKVLDAVKPYKGGNDALWRLHKLDNIDKHRALLTAGSAYRSFDIAALARDSMLTFGPLPKDFQPVQLFIRPADRMCPLKAGDELLRHSVDTNVSKDLQFRFDVAFNEPQIIESESIIEALHQWFGLVSAVVADFRRVL